VKLPNLGAMYSEMGKACAPPNTQLRCDVCDRAEPLTPEAASTYMACGWPKCCGHTMKLESAHPPASPAGDDKPEESC
jgi:hypothetical protein